MPELQTVLALFFGVIAITFHEASHGYVAWHFGDDTAWREGRITLNPLKHIDPFGTVILPALLYLTAGFLFGYAKPVPVNFGGLRNPRKDMVWVAAAGPATNIVLAIVSALLLHLVRYCPSFLQYWLAVGLEISIEINVVLAVFNMIPLPPLDGGRVAVGLLPDFLALPLARFERQGMLILIGLLVLLPMIGRALNLNLSLFSLLLEAPVEYVVKLIMKVTGHV
jgi:Zn-dependent protease